MFVADATDMFVADVIDMFVELMTHAPLTRM